MASTRNLKELRRLILRPEQEHLSELQGRLDDPRQQAMAVSRILPDAIDLRSLPDSRLSNSLLPSVEKAIETSVNRNPEVIADALYPVMGPAIRRSLAGWLAGLLQSFNQTLEVGFTPQGLAWRWEAWRTGTSFAEVVLLHTLRFRVEQVFLIHRESGLLVQHVVADAVAAQDPDLVSAMLTAIQDFVRDSFYAEDGDSLQSMEFGERKICIEHGPQAALAAVVRGTVTGELRVLLREALERVHQLKNRELVGFQGETGPFESIRPELEDCLQSRYQTPTKKRSPVPWIVLGLLILLVGAWMFFQIRRSWRWQNYLELVQSQPGLIVTSVERRSGSYHLTGLRDPLARDPRELLPEAGLEEGEVVVIGRHFMLSSRISWSVVRACSWRRRILSSWTTRQGSCGLPDRLPPDGLKVRGSGLI